MSEKFQPLIEQMQRTASSYGTKLIASELNKAPSSLYAELNPYDAQGKLGLVDAARIMEMTGDIAMLDMLAGMFGCTLIRNDAAPVAAETAFRVIAEVTSNVGELAQRLKDALDDGALSKAERLDLFRIAADTHASLAPFCTGMSGMRQ